MYVVTTCKVYKVESLVALMWLWLCLWLWFLFLFGVFQIVDVIYYFDIYTQIRRRILWH